MKITPTSRLASLASIVLIVFMLCVSPLTAAEETPASPDMSISPDIAISPDTKMPPKLHYGDALEGYTAWLPEWVLTDAFREANAQKSGLSSIQVFAAYFDRSDDLLLPPPIQNWAKYDSAAFIEKFVQRPDEVQIPIHLSVVNDIYDPAGSSLKDQDLVTRLISDPARRAAHIDALLKLLDEGPYDGLEIDYERVKREDWANFLTFCAELYEKTDERKKTLRVVLEPQRRFYELSFPEGPEYVLMAYNLFGFHSGPGPKADPKFIGDLAKMTDSMQKRPRIAIATGGFIWDTSKGKNDPGRVKSITESEAHLLYQREGIEPKRDAASGYQVFQFPKNAKKPQVVWFADGETLAFLARAAKKSGFNDFALWRFAGNRRVSLDTWRTEVNSK